VTDDDSIAIRSIGVLDLSWDHRIIDGAEAARFLGKLKERIETGLPGSAADVSGEDGHHFEAVVVAPQFDGLSRIAQHRLVYELFEGELGGRIHALSLQTKAPVRTSS